MKFLLKEFLQFIEKLSEHAVIHDVIDLLP